jgi:hypothetical protein
MPDPKWITFEDAGPSQSGKTRLWRVVNRQDGVELGDVHWDAGWRRYVFAPRAFTIYEQDCLRDLAAFVSARTADHRAAAQGVAGG